MRCLTLSSSHSSRLFIVSILSYAWSCRSGFISSVYFFSFVCHSLPSLYFLPFILVLLFFLFPFWSLEGLYFRAYRTLAQSWEHLRRFSRLELGAANDGDLSILILRGSEEKNIVCGVKSLRNVPSFQARDRLLFFTG